MNIRTYFDSDVEHVSNTVPGVSVIKGNIGYRLNFFCIHSVLNKLGVCIRDVKRDPSKKKKRP